MLLGAVLVFGQLIGAVMGNGALVLGLNEALKEKAIGAATICAFAGFFMSYLRGKEKK